MRPWPMRPWWVFPMSNGARRFRPLWVLKAGVEATESELQDFVKERLRSSRTPEEIGFWPELPYNETGKLLRRKVRSELMAG